MRLPKSVGWYLEEWGYHPLQRQDFASNFLSSRIGPTRDRGRGDFVPQQTFVSLCAVPSGRDDDRVQDLNGLAKWLDPNARQYQPLGLWLPVRNGQRFTSQGILRFEEDYTPDTTPSPWSAYMLVGRDGYVEYGRQAGFPLGGKLYYHFSPLVAWIQRFIAFVADLRGQLVEAPNYYLVLNIANPEGASLCSLGNGWREPFDWIGLGTSSQALELRVQIARPLHPAESSIEGAGWFAERIANTFGESEVRCFNRTDPIGELPKGRTEFQ